MDDIKRAIRLHLISGVLVSFFGYLLVVLFIKGIPMDIPICRSFGGYAGMWGFRLAGTAYEPAGFANYLLSVIPITFALWLNAKKPINGIILFCAFIIQLIAMLFTLSSGGWVALVIILPIMLIRLWWMLNRTKKIGLLCLTLLPIILLGQLAASGILPVDRASFVLIGKFTNDTPGKTDRLATAEILLAMVKDYPILGIGPGNFVYKVRSYTDVTQDISDASNLYMYPATWKANNDYLTIAAETGLIGFLVFAIFIGTLLKYLLRTLKSVKGTEDDALITGMVFAIIALLMQSAVSFSILNLFVWVLAAFVISYQRLKSSKYNENRL